MAPSSLPAPETLAAAAHLSQRDADIAVIRGKRLPLCGLIKASFFEPDHLAELQKHFYAAKPFEHLVLKDIFSAQLLDMVHEEFDLFAKDTIGESEDARKKILRSQTSPALGPASQLYFSAVNSGPFLEALAAISKTPGLVADVTLKNGGLHETRAGGRFDVHLDYATDERTCIPNKLVLLTYLNRDWQPEYGGNLELWNKKKCVAEVAPDFGTSILFMHSNRSFHGHPAALTPPPGRTRRSVASYYYAHPPTQFVANALTHTRFLVQGDPPLSLSKLKNALQWVTPPIVLEAARQLRNQLAKMTRGKI